MCVRKGGIIMASREKGFWFLLSAYMGAAALAYPVLVLLFGMRVEHYVGLVGISMLLSVPLVLLVQWLWRKKHPRVEDTDEREKMIRGKAREAAGCSLLAVLCLAGVAGTTICRHYGVEMITIKVEWFIPIMLAGYVVWELGREITLRVLHGRERRRGED